MNYVPGKDLICSSTLSRAPLKKQTPEISETEVNCHIYSVISSFSISTGRLKQVELETLNDKTLQRPVSYIAQGWLKLQNQLYPYPAHLEKKWSKSYTLETYLLRGQN